MTMTDSRKAPRPAVRRIFVSVCFGAGLVLTALYAAAGDYLPAASFSFYVHSYSFHAKNILLLGPALLVFSLAFSGASSPLVKKARALVLRPGSGSFACMVFFVFSAAAAAVCLFLLEGIPHVQDSIAQLFQARVFASGSIHVPLPPNARFFDMQFVLDNGAVRYGKYFFGQSLFPLIGVLVRAPWLINPLAGGLTIVLTCALARHCYDEKTARLTALLLLASPFYLFMHASFMSHAPHLLLVTGCLLCLAKAAVTQRRWCFVLGGALCGFALTVKPFDTVLFLSPFLAYGFMNILRGRGALSAAALFAVPVVCCGACVLAYNYLLTGDAMTTGYALYEPHSGLGFGAHMGETAFWGDGMVRGHTPFKGAIGIVKQLMALNDDLFGWPDLSLAFAAVLFVFFKTNRWERLMAAACLCVAGGYFFYWAIPYTFCFGPRYCFVCVPVLAVLTARGIIRSPQILNAALSRLRFAGLYNSSAAVGMFVLMLAALSTSLYMPRSFELYGSSYWNVDNRLYDSVRSANLSNALVFVESEYYREVHSAPDYYNSVFNRNSLLLDGPVVYARDFGPAENSVLIEQYPGRDYYLYRTTGERRGTLCRLQPHDD